MATPAIPARPGFFGRVYYTDNGQRRKVGPWLDMADPAKAWRTALDVQHQHAHRALSLEVIPVKSAHVAAVQTIVLKDFTTGLAGIAADLPPSPLPAMQPNYYPNEPAQQQVQVMRPLPQAQEPPANMDHMGQFMFRQQEARLLEARNEVWDLQQRLRATEGEKVAMKEKLDKAQIDLQYKDREHLHNLKDREREIRDEYESQEAKPSGLAGLSEVLTNPQHPLAGLLGLVATKLLGGEAPGAPGAPAGGPQLTGTYSANMVEILDAIGALLPTEEVGVKVYTSLHNILAREDGLLQLQNIAGQSVADAA